YWGIHNIREKSNASTLDYYHGEDDIDLLKNNNKISQGDADNYEDFIDYVESNDMSDPVHYEVIKDWMDIAEYMNYHIASQYAAHTSWPANNMKYWRPRKASGEWRWFMHDIDSGFDLREDGRCYADQIAYTTTSSSNPYEWSQVLLRELLKNDEFRHEFGQRYAANLSLTYDPGRVIDIIDDLEAGIEPEIPRHIGRWGFLNDLDDWHDQVDVMRDFAQCRPAEIISHIQDNLDDFGSTSNLTINIVNPQGGEVFVHDILLLEDSVTGEFFDDIPIQLHAKPKVGYRFVGWQEIGDPTKKTSLLINNDFVITAVFEAYTPPALVINEIHYNPAPTQGIDEDYEFIEIYNADSVAIDLTGYRISEGIEFTFTTGLINPGEYILVTSNASTYSGNGYQVFEWDPLTNGKLDNGGETIRLKDSYDFVVDVVDYEDDSPWVSAPDGNGPSLELIATHLENAGDDVDPSAYYNWVASDVNGGTPGYSNDDTPRVTIVQSAGNTTVAEGGITDSYQIFLNTLPTNPVDIRITPDNQLDLGAGMGQAITLTFTAVNARNPRTVTVTAVDDLIDEGAHSSTITHQASSADGDYDGITIDDVVVAIADNDTPGITLTETGGNTAVSEDGTTDSYTLVLDSVPTDDVEIMLSPDGQLDLGAGAGQPITLTFTSVTALDPQAVTVTAVDDSLAEGPHTGTITHQSSSADGRYNNFAISDVTAAITDNDNPNVILSQTTLTISEDGASDQYTIRLDSTPTDDVIITLNPDDQINLGNGLGNTVVITFTPATAFTPQTITAVTSDDAIVEGTQNQIIQHTAASGDADYDGFVISDVDVTITDNDAAGVTLIESAGSTQVSEDGLTDSYQIVLDRRPDADVIITVDPRNQLDVGAGPGVAIDLTFTPSNALTPQTVTVSAVDDQFDEGVHDSKVNHSVQSANVPYDQLSLPSITAAIADNDTAGFTIVESGGNTEVTENGAGDSYTILLDTIPIDDVEIIITPDDTIDVGNGAGVPLTLLIEPNDALQPHTVTITAVDDGVVTSTRTAVVEHVVASNDLIYNALQAQNLSLSVIDGGPTAVVLQGAQLFVAQGAQPSLLLLLLMILLTGLTGGMLIKQRLEKFNKRP
ncbi:MAG: CotH kinase family protein, partial [Anaerolineales bacterium]|nr:CotH kinase family protein [Anaerolineales bacterium]